MPLLPSQGRTGLLIDLHAVSALHPYHAKQVPQDLQMQHQWVNKRDITVTNMEGEPRRRQEKQNPRGAKHGRDTGRLN